MPTLPVGPEAVAVPQVSVIMTGVLVPATTGNGALVPVQL